MWNNISSYAHMIVKRECENMAVHIVAAGENLWTISKKYGVPIQTIVELNGLPSSGAIAPGLALHLPDNLPPLRYYRIKAGDHIWNIAQHFNVDPAAILAVN